MYDVCVCVCAYCVPGQVEGEQCGNGLPHHIVQRDFRGFVPGQASNVYRTIVRLDSIAQASVIKIVELSSTSRSLKGFDKAVVAQLGAIVAEVWSVALLSQLFGSVSRVLCRWTHYACKTSWSASTT